MTADEVSKLNPGDKIRCTLGCGRYYHAGGIYFVKKIDSRFLYTVLDDEGNDDNGWEFQCFELVSKIKREPTGFGRFLNAHGL